MAVLKELGLGGTTAWRVRRRAYMLPFARRRRGAAGVSVWCPTAPKGPERWRARGVWVRGVNSASNGSNEAFDSHTASFLSGPLSTPSVRRHTSAEPCDVTSLSLSLTNGTGQLKISRHSHYTRLGPTTLTSSEAAAEASSWAARAVAAASFS